MKTTDDDNNNNSNNGGGDHFTTIALDDDDNDHQVASNSNGVEKNSLELKKINGTTTGTNKDDDGGDEKKPKEKSESASFVSLFQYASTLDKIFMGFGTIFAICLGLTFPAIILLMGQITDTFVQYQIFDELTKFPTANIRYQYFNSTLSKLDDDLKFFEAIQEFYVHTVNISELDPEFIRARTGLSLHKIVHIYNDSIFQDGTLYVDIFREDSGLLALYMGLVAIGFGILDYFALGLWEQAARNQNFRIKLLFFRSIIHQDIEWFDMKSSGDFATKITNDLNLVQQGMGDKIALCIMSFGTLVFSLGIAFYHGWELTLVSMAIMPFMAVAFAVIGKVQVKFAADESKSYSKAGAIAEEVINLIRTVYAFGGQQKEIQRYEENIQPARKNGIRRSMFTGISLGLMYFSIYASYGLAFWYGVRLIIRSIENRENPPKYQASTMLVVFFNVLMGAFSIGQTSPYFETIARACGAAGTIFKVINQKPKIDSFSTAGKRINIKGKVDFRSVRFSYPTRKEVPILQGINLEAKPNQTIALVGPSGCGKSTVIQLIQRFYDPDEGTIMIDDIDIRELNVGFLRDQIGVVGQEPVLFGYSIQQNIAFGHPEANFEEIKEAAKQANAYDFIMNLPDGFQTMVGERGAQLSGGQKQRIAIARALIRKPKILLLDESTSALDSESESVVQAALDRASINRTTFIVAHRLSTIRNADKIIVIESGRVREMGTHQELIDAKGIYYNMARLQHQDHGNSGEPVVKEEVVSRVNQRSRSIISARSSGKGSISGEIIEEENDDKNAALPVKRLLNIVMPDRWYLAIATLFSFIIGLTVPIYAFIFGEVLGIISSTNTESMRNEVLKYSMIFVAIGVISGVLQFFQAYLYGLSSENLTYRLRKQVFECILRQEIAWFDQPGNNTGALCARLSNDAAAVQGATGSRLSIIAQTIAILSAGCVIALFYCWKLGLVMMLFIPVILVAIYFQMRVIMGLAISNKKANEKATKIAVETISNIRTVASLHLELTFWINYQHALEDDFHRSRFEPHIKSGTFGATQAVFNLAYSIALFYGSRLIISHELDYAALFKSTEAVLFGTSMIGQTVAFSPDYQKGKIAAVAIFKMLDRIPKILMNTAFGRGKTISGNECRGEIQFKDVEFRYPTRPKARILKRMTFGVNPGQTVALVGSSGCGKSTCTQILERFYDIENGQVLLDRENIVGLDIEWLRRQIGIVSQEPMLFDKTIAENIAYGDNSRVVSMDEITMAARNANIHEFIQGLPNGYQTSVGDKGAQLSGGQKQRIAIARALVRNPKILLLDEATSALDSESEKIVQRALDEARNGRTCLIIAHRLSTIQDVDQIFVIEHGRVVESGTHTELLERGGLYRQMYTAQCGSN